eukprot:TRINITY_DN8978_c0_g1_i3.p5 TRINITY_DN8978_c0_g1~~TRINITY_DN8978_c0_g1_i3.p5  ORF type:complete len:101 (-),score=6.24 TRINITY_DN8978_c0_g1_i3:796-1062(-)
MPAVEFRFDMSPIAVSILRPQRSVLHFLVRLCAVVGGCVALMKFLDKVVTSTIQMIKGSQQQRLCTVRCTAKKKKKKKIVEIKQLLFE